MAKSLRVGIAGLGTVGASVVALLRDNGDALALRAGRPIELVRAASRTPKPDLGLEAVFDTDLRIPWRPTTWTCSSN